MHVYGYILNNLPPYAAHEYAARVQDLRTYHSICRDIVTRWVYPFVRSDDYNYIALLLVVVIFYI